jgi:hypothetical protein
MKFIKITLLCLLMLPISAMEICGQNTSAISVAGENKFQFSYSQSFPSARHYEISKNINSQNTKGFVNAADGGFLQPFRESPGVAFLGSAIVPGFSQAVNKKWWRSAVYFGAEAGLIFANLRFTHLGDKNESKYERYVNQNWSVEKYTAYLVDYRNNFFPNDNKMLEDYVVGGATVDPGNWRYGPDSWETIDINSLRDLEQLVLYGGTNGVPFSHSIPDYGSQQYYELVSKYFQFGPGWSDFNTDVDMMNNNWNESMMSAQWMKGRDDAEEFNDQLRAASYMVTAMIINHFVSAFDALFTVQIQQHRMGNSGLQTTPMMSFEMSF